MFSIQRRYDGFGCYRFLDNESRTIYVGKSKNIHRRLFSQHFKKSGYGHLPKDCYKSTCKIEIIKCKDHAQTVALEQFLIDKYLPKFNTSDKRKDIFNSTYFENQEQYEKLEKWHLYYTFREYDFDKIKLTKKQNKLTIAATVVFFIFTIFYLLN